MSMAVVHEFEVKSSLGMVQATWQRKGRMIEIRYGNRMKSEVASSEDAGNLFVARDVVTNWIREDMRA